MYIKNSQKFTLVAMETPNLGLLRQKGGFAPAKKYEELYTQKA